MSEKFTINKITQLNMEVFGAVIWHALCALKDWKMVEKKNSKKV